MQGLIPCVSPLATCPPLCLIVWKIDMWLCIVLDWVRGWVARMGFLLPALSPDPPDLLDARHKSFLLRFSAFIFFTSALSVSSILPLLLWCAW